jgi:hypothetical protein
VSSLTNFPKLSLKQNFRPREFENCMNEPPTEKSQKACPQTCESDKNDCICVADKQKKSCSDLHAGHEQALVDCLKKPAASHILEQCLAKKGGS